MDLVMLICAGAAAAYLLWPRQKADSAQDLIACKEIHSDGLIELPGYKFRLVMEIEPINLGLRSFQEQAAVWLNLRSMVNSLNVPCTFLVQTRYLNLKDYINEYRKLASGYGEHVAGYISRLCDWLAAESEGKQQRDRRLYVILKIDAASTGIESGIQTDNPIVNSALKSIGGIGKSKLPPDELRRLGREELFEAAAVVRSYLENSEVRSYVLDRKAVLEMLYQTFNRDLAPYARLVEADQDEVFTLFTRSNTPERVERGLMQNV